MKKSELRQMIREEIQAALNEQTVTEDRLIQKFDDVHIKSKNLTGIVYSISGKNAVVKTVKGLVKAKTDDLEFVDRGD